MQSSLQLCSTFKDNNTLELSLQETEVPTPGPKEIVVRVEAAPLNPTDLATLLGPAETPEERTSNFSVRKNRCGYKSSETTV